MASGIFAFICGADRDLVKLTLASLRKTQTSDAARGKVRVLLDHDVFQSLQASGGVDLRSVEPCDLKEWASSETDGAWIVFVEAGTEVKDSLLSALDGNRSSFPNQQIFVLPDDDDDYPLQNSLPDEFMLSSYDYGKSRIWLGSPGFALDAILLRNIDFDHRPSRLFLLLYIFFSAMTQVGAFGVLRGCTSHSIVGHEDKARENGLAYDRAWYLEFNEIWKRLFAGYDGLDVPPLFQRAYLYDLQWRLLNNADTRNLHILNDEELASFWSATADNLQQVEDDVIRAQDAEMAVKINFGVRRYLLELKNGPSSFQAFSNEIAWICGDRAQAASSTRLTLVCLDYDQQGRRLKLSGFTSFPLSDDITLFLQYGKELIELPDCGRYADYKLFGKTIYRTRPFNVTLAPPNAKESSISFFLMSKSTGSKVPLAINFTRPMSKLSNHRRSYWHFGDWCISPSAYSLAIKRSSRKMLIKKEWLYLRNLLLRGDLTAKKAALFRLLYWVTRPFYSHRKSILLFFDKLYKAGDNGEYLYRYSRTRRDGFRKYYVLNKTSVDARRFRRQGLPFTGAWTTRNRLLLLNARAVFATHVDITRINGFPRGIECYFRDLFSYEVLFIQHGLLVQRLQQYQHQAYDNTKRYYIASPLEYANIKDPSYGFDSSQIVKSGQARYDGLRDRNRRMILIAPSWRNYLATPGVAFETRDRDDKFKETEYFRIYNSLVNDSRLTACAKEHGYKIVLLLHPIVSPQVGDFQGNDVVDILASTEDASYEDLLAEGSLMVTDFSGVQFDFAYMYKPVVYFHPPELPPSYDEAVYRYATDGLGEILASSDELVDTVVEYIENDCALKPEYRERIDKFFYYHDFNNCQRIYDSAIAYLNDGGFN